MNDIKISITKYPSSGQVKVTVKDKRGEESMWLSSEAYRQLAMNIREDIAEEATEHRPVKGRKYD
jgi:hypothetical protein